ncbi:MULTISPECIES: ABC transporter permease [Helcococcus]|uniref:ABC transporter permease n=1 Tax=Helcococcus bovis TaxID=3153252 RepID=A0ABW9F7P3_9FIRM
MNKKTSFFEKFYLLFVFIFLYAPIAVLIFYSFNQSRILGVWSGFSLKWYQRLFEDRAILNAVNTTLLVGVIATIVSTIVGTFAAVGISEFSKNKRRIILGINDIPVLNPDIVIAISLMVLYGMLKIPKGLLTLILSHIAFTIPYVVLSVLPKIKQMDKNLIDAALDLGATPIQALIKVVIPEIKPGIIAGAMMAFTLSIDDFVISFFTVSPGLNTIATTVFSMTKRGIEPTINALSTLMFVAVLILLIIVNILQNKNMKKNKEKIDR